MSSSHKEQGTLRASYFHQDGELDVTGGTLQVNSSFAFQTGTTTIAAGATVSVTNSYWLNGKVSLSGATLRVQTELEIRAGGIVQGSGTVDADVVNEAGRVIVGEDGTLGSLRITGGYTQKS